MKLLEKLLSINSPSGNEEEIRNFIKDEISDYVDEISIDTLGNLIAKKHSTISHNKIMLTSNMDEPGLIATVIEKKGIARFSLIGKLNENSLLHKKVKFKGNRLGIIFAEKEKDFTLRDMYIDPIGSKIEVGDVAVFEGGSIYIDNEYLCSKAIGNRVGCYILINIIKSLKSCNNDLYFAFTVQEALGSRGAKTAAFSLQPDYAIHVGVTNAYDIPGEQKSNIKLKNGPVIKIMDSSIIAHPIIKNILIQSAEKTNLPYQVEVIADGSNDSGAIHLVKGGIPSGALSIPVRYLKSPNELCSLDDVNNAIEILKEAICFGGINE